MTDLMNTDWFWPSVIGILGILFVVLLIWRAKRNEPDVYYNCHPAQKPKKEDSPRESAPMLLPLLVVCIVFGVPIGTRFLVNYYSAKENGMTKQTFACAINCMDGRVQEPVRTFMRNRYGVDFVDKVTEPGPNKILAENSQPAVVQRIKERLDISVHHHGSKVIAIVGHAECAGNPAEKDEQIVHLRQAEKTVKAFGFDAEIILLYVHGDWKTVELVGL